ncbi:DUF1559 domain-containing protein [Victivallis vadensis]|uniref:DUF1559 family PulG-like putative transporter n=1 Tax=Victivallis vadensis TaxID=172901 RepID=UPI003CFE06B3
MKKRFLTTLLAGAAGLTLAAGAAELSPAAAEKALFDSTARHLDFGGNYYNYLSIDGMPGQFEELFVSMLTASGEADSAEVADVVKLVIGLLNFEVVQAFGSSSIIAADAPGVYVNKSFIRLSEAQPKGVLFDLAGRENRKLAGLKMIPANTRLAFGLHLDPGPAWKTLSAALAASQQEEVKNLPAELAGKAEQVLGCKFDDFLAGLTGEAFFLLTSDGTFPDIQPKLLLILPDGKGLLARLLLKHADELKFQKESDTLYTIQVPGLPPFVKPRLILEKGRIVIASSADIYDLARAADGGAATAPELAPYFRNMPGDGLGFLYLNVPASLVQSAIQLGATMSEELATLQPTFAQLPGLTIFSVSRKEAEGYAGVMRSNLSAAQLQVAAPMLVYSGMLLPALNQAREKARRISCVNNVKQIMLGLTMYANDHDSRFPADNGAAGLNTLVKDDYLTDFACYICPSATDDKGSGNLTEDTCSYIYLGGTDLAKEQAPSKLPVVFDKPGNHRKGVSVGFADGHVEQIDLPRYHSPEQVIDYLVQNRGLPEETGKVLKQKLQKWNAAQTE